MTNKKTTYQTPRIELVTLDSEISLALSSAPPAGPDESFGKAPEYFDPNSAVIS